MDCATCGGLGLVKTETGARPCQCQDAARAEAQLVRARIPREYENATLASFQPAAHTSRALTIARAMVEQFIPGQRGDRAGLMLTGGVGTGKTHLAVGIVRELIEKKGVECRFVDMRILMDRLRSSYDDDARESQAQILRPITAADLVVIDELGAARPSDWVFETVELLIGGLYNQVTPVIVTSNFQNLAPGASAGENGYERAARSDTLGDRIGARMWSRLQQMCQAVDMTGPDWRMKR